MRTLSLENIFKLVVLLVVVALVMMLIVRFSTLVAYAVIALIISYILEPFVNRLQSSGMNRKMGIVIVISSLILILVWLFTTIIPAVGNQVVGLTKQLTAENIRIISAQIEREAIQIIPFMPEGFIRDNLSLAADTLFSTDMSGTIGNVLGIFANLFWAVLVIPFATFFFLKDGSNIRRFFLKFVPNHYFEITLSVINKIETRLGFYFKSVGLQSVLVALFSWLFLSIAGLNNSLSVGIAVGVANIIPYFGPVLGYFLSVIVAVFETGDFTLVIWAVLAIAATQMMDNILFQPLIFSRSADIHPLAVLFVIMIGAEVAGFFGMLIAVPIAASLKIMIVQINWSFKNYYVFRANQVPPVKTSS